MTPDQVEHGGEDDAKLNAADLGYFTKLSRRDSEFRTPEVQDWLDEQRRRRRD
jgi:hypothetical protein